MNRAARGCLVVTGVAILLTACSLFKAQSTAPHAPLIADTTRVTWQISQVDFGRNARYAHCVEPACPNVTPKTLASALSLVAASRAVVEPPAEPGSAQSVARLAPAATSPGSPRTLTLRFGTNSAVLSASHQLLLHNALGELRRTERIVIAGRTDDRGSEAINQALALARALAIRDHLLDLAPDLPARIAIDAKGRCCYAAPNDSLAGRAQNRRVEVAYTLRDEGLP